MLIETLELKRVLAEIKDKLLALEKTANGKAAKIALGAEMRVVEKLLVFVTNSEKEGELNMEKLNKVLNEDLVDIEDIRVRKDGAELRKKIKEWAQVIPPGKAKPIPQDNINPNSFISVVGKMRKSKEIPDYIHAANTKNGLYLTNRSSRS